MKWLSIFWLVLLLCAIALVGCSTVDLLTAKMSGSQVTRNVSISPVSISVDESNFAIIGERDTTITKTVTYYNDGVTTQSINQSVHDQIAKNSVVNVVNIIVGTLVGWFAKTKVG